MPKTEEISTLPMEKFLRKKKNLDERGKLDHFHLDDLVDDYSELKELYKLGYSAGHDEALDGSGDDINATIVEFEEKITNLNQEIESLNNRDKNADAIIREKRAVIEAKDIEIKDLQKQIDKLLNIKQHKKTKKKNQ